MLRLCFYTFGQNGHAQRLTQVHDGTDNGMGTAITGQAANQGRVNLELADGQLLQLSEAAIPGT